MLLFYSPVMTAAPGAGPEPRTGNLNSYVMVNMDAPKSTLNFSPLAREMLEP
jgi:hypothetical protein